MLPGFIDLHNHLTWNGHAVCHGMCPVMRYPASAPVDNTIQDNLRKADDQSFQLLVLLFAEADCTFDGYQIVCPRRPQRRGISFGKTGDERAGHKLLP
jgi:hypothetical protein